MLCDSHRVNYYVFNLLKSWSFEVFVCTHNKNRRRAVTRHVQLLHYSSRVGSARVCVFALSYGYISYSSERYLCTRKPICILHIITVKCVVLRAHNSLSSPLKIRRPCDRVHVFALETTAGSFEFYPG